MKLDTPFLPHDAKALTPTPVAPPYLASAPTTSVAALLRHPTLIYFTKSPPITWLRRRLPTFAPPYLPSPSLTDEPPPSFFYNRP